MQTRRPKRFYVRGDLMPVEEDATHEFKGHRNFAEEEIPPSALVPGSDRRTRQPVSRTFNAFMNSGHGGIVYLGVHDSGEIQGMNLTQYRKDHLVVSLDDLFKRYNPPVEKHRYDMKFIPVVNANSSAEEREHVIYFNASKNISSEDRKRPHTLRSSKYCWCDKDHIAQHNHGIYSIPYIVEVVIKPWDPEDPRNKFAVGQMKTNPLHEDETGGVYFRRQSSLVQYTKEELANFSRQKVIDFYQPKIRELEAKLYRQVEEAAAQKMSDSGHES